MKKINAEFSEVGTFQTQIEVLKKFVDEECTNYIKKMEQKVDTITISYGT